MRKKETITVGIVLQEALVGYVPSFGNDRDIAIVERLGKLQKLLAQVDLKILRKPKTDKERTAKMREILSLEEQLARSIISQKMDF